MPLDPTRLVRLSHDLAENTPAYGDNPTVVFPPKRSIRKGDPCNSRFIRMPLHTGTHVDAPRHFSDAMPSLTELPLDAFLYSKPVVIDVPKNDGELIGDEDLEPLAAAIAGADFLAVRTGFARYRTVDGVLFGQRGPGFAPDAADFLMRTAPGLRALGMDTVSAASFVHPEEGIEFHRRMLGRKRGDRYVLLVEDMNLAAWAGPLAEVWVVPLLVRDGDGAPCTVFGVRP